MTADPKSQTTAKVLRVLQVEDVETDAELVLRELKRRGILFESSRVWTEESFFRALTTFTPDVILSDYSMPAFDGLRALGLARELAPGTAFIFVSGSIRPEDAANALNNGASDYLVKGDLMRLGPVVGRTVGRR